MARSRPWDLLVLGGGTAGLVAARTAASLGARVALVERARTGGECLWTGCVPSKALVAAARSGCSGEEALARVRAAITAIQPDDDPRTLERAGARVVVGDARFVAEDAVEVDGRRHPFVRALVATGSQPAPPPVPGLAEAGVLTTDTVWDLTAVPDRLLVLGGAATGCELGQAFARLGARVTLCEAADRLLVQEDPEASALVEAALTADGVDVRTSSSVTRLRADPTGGGTATVSPSGGGAPTGTVEYDAVLIATGRRARTDGLGLAAAGVEVDGTGAVAVDDGLRTTNRRVWAAGDVTAHPRATHVAGVHGSIAATNAVLGTRRRVDLTAVPRVTYTDPEVAAVGSPTWAADGEAPRTRTVPLSEVDRARTDGRTDGFTRLALDRRHRVVGGTLVGPRAGEALAEVALAVRLGVTTAQITSTMHAYPTFADGTWAAAIEDVQARLRSPVARRLTRAVVAVRRRWGR
jgi:pyruvate/2-oxoglutarate dehydrogenase complex dihydrolipoamide dehydrogenase (E3) component